MPRPIPTRFGLFASAAERAEALHQRGQRRQLLAYARRIGTPFERLFPQLPPRPGYGRNGRRLPAWERREIRRRQAAERRRQRATQPVTSQPDPMNRGRRTTMPIVEKKEEKMTKGQATRMVMKDLCEANRALLLAIAGAGHLRTSTVNELSGTFRQIEMTLRQIDAVPAEKPVVA